MAAAKGDEDALGLRGGWNKAGGVRRETVGGKNGTEPGDGCLCKETGKIASDCFPFIK